MNEMNELIQEGGVLDFSGTFEHRTGVVKVQGNTDGGGEG